MKSSLDSVAVRVVATALDERTGGKVGLAKQRKSVAANDFAEILLEITDEACSCLSETGKKVVYSHLQKQFGIGR